MKTSKTIWCAFATLAFAATSLLANSDLTTVNIGYATSVHSEVAKVLAKTSIPKEHGLEVNTTFFQYGPPQIEGLVSKTLDVSFTSLVPTATYLDKQAGVVKVIAELGHSIHGVLVPDGDSTKTLKDLRGKSIGVPFLSDSHIDLLAALKEAGLDPMKDVKLINLAPNEQAAAFQQHLVDAIMARPPMLERLQQELHAHEVQEWEHHLWVIARADYLEEHPGVEQKLVAAIRAGVLYVQLHPQEAATWYAQDLRQKPAAVLSISQLNPIFVPGAKVDITPSDELRAFAQKRSQQMFELGVTKTRVNFFPESAH
ncbi:MAG TPA: NrtA/SsuA/CpmA family ABC transporter substrate-binding protein [Opitutaceae bacterium]